VTGLGSKKQGQNRPDTAADEQVRQSG